MRTVDIRDLPIENENEDLLNLDKYAKALASFIQSSETPLTISLQGEWGSGKTSLMNMLKKKLCNGPVSKSFESIWINTWELYLKNEDKDAIEHLTFMMLSEINRIAKERNVKLGNEIEEVVDSFKQYFFKTADFLMSIKGADGDARKKALGIFNQSDNTYIKQIREKLSRIVNKLTHEKNNVSDRGFIIFIDDLDRIQPALAVKVLEVLKNLFTIENCIFVLAVDYEVIVRGLQAKYGDAQDGDKKYRSYFDKLIQLPFVMPLGKYDISLFVKQALLDISYFDKQEMENEWEMKQLYQIIQLTVGNNPRSLKRLMNTIKLSRIFDQCNDSILTDYGLRMANMVFLCIQLAYPKIYSMFEMYPAFKDWKEHQFSMFIKDEVAISEAALPECPWKRILYKTAISDPELKPKQHSIMTIADSLEELFNYHEQLKDSDLGKILSLSSLTHFNYKSTGAVLQYDGEAYDRSSQTQHKQGGKLIDMIDLSDNLSVLDVGCGNGKTTMDLFSRNPLVKIDAFDLSPSQIKIAQERRKEQNISGDSLNFFVKNALSIDYQDKYDLIFSNSALHWVTEADKMYSLLFRSLKPGGRLAVHQGGFRSYYGLHDAVWKAIANLKFDSYFVDWEYPIFYPTVEVMESILEKAGFGNIQVRSVCSDGKEFQNLVENFANASCLPYLSRLPEKADKDLLMEEYYNICTGEDIDTYTHRLYIFANKDE